MPHRLVLRLWHPGLVGLLGSTNMLYISRKNTFEKKMDVLIYNVKICSSVCVLDCLNRKFHD